MIPIVVVLEVSSGMIEGITRRFIEVSSFHLQAGTYGGTEGEIDDQILTAIESLEGVKSAVPFVQGQGLLYSRESRSGVQIRGVDSCLYEKDFGFRKYFTILAGEFGFGEDSRGLLISSSTSDDLGLEVGDPVKLLISRTSSRGNKPVLKPGNYHVSGIFSTGYHELDKFMIYMERGRAERIFGKEGSLGIGIKTDVNTDSLKDLKKSVEEVLDESWYVIPWYDQERSLYRNLETTRTMLLLIMAIIIVVAAVNISSSMLNLVMEKQEQIAVLKSMGASPGGIRFQFLVTGFVTGFLGVCLGMILGILISVNINQVIALIERLLGFFVYAGRFLINPLQRGEAVNISLMNPEYYLEKIPIKLPLGDLFMIGGFTLLSAVLASWFPAKKASRITPLEIIRHHG